MAVNILVVFILGLLAGWLIEWVIDWAYWRRPKKAAPGGKYQSHIRPADPLPMTKENIQSRLDMMVNRYPALGDVVASLVAQPDKLNKSPEVVAKKMQTDLAVWFEDVMDRASGDYRRRAGKWALLLGTVLAFVFNVDSIEIATRMWQEPTLRQVIVAQAENYQGTEVEATMDEFVDQVNQLAIPVGWSTVPPIEGERCGWIPGQAVYPYIRSEGSCLLLSNLPRMDDGWGWLLKFFGLLISGIAAAQGAPFWFDILNKVINLRGTGRVPKSTQNESAAEE